MDRIHELFSTQELVQFQAQLKITLIDSAKTPWSIAKTVLQTIVLFIVGFVEWEIIYRVFDYLSGENDYWSPEIMGLTAAIMIIGFHLLAYNAPHNFAVRFVNRAVQFLIPLYMVGELSDVTEAGWIDELFSNVTDPLAVIAFTLGLGGLAIVNIFVAHHLLTLISANIEDITGRLSRTKQALQDHNTILRTQKHYAALGNDLADLNVWDDFTIRMYITSDVLSVIADALLPHKQWLMDQEMDERSPFGPQETTDPKYVASRIKKIEAISSKDVLKALTPPKFLENRS